MRGHDMIPSAADFCLRDVTLDLVDVGANNGANPTATAILNVHLRHGVNIEFLRHGRSPVDDVDLAQRNRRIATRHLFQAR